MRLKTCAMPDISRAHPWQVQSIQEQTCYTGIFNGSDQLALKQALEHCAVKAVGLLDKNIQDDSLYLLFEWFPTTSELHIVVTDAGKQHDGVHKVQAYFPEILNVNSTNTPEQLNVTNDSIKFLLSDFLASYSAFFSYSLVAIFHSSSRAETSLL